MERIDFMRCVIAKITSLNPISRLVDDLLLNGFIPHLFINLDNFVVNSSDSKEVIFPELKEILLKLNNLDNKFRVVFLSNRPNECYWQTSSQLSNLLCTNNFTLYMTNEKNFVHVLDQHIMSHQDVRFCFRPWFIYLDDDFERCKTAAFIFELYNFQHTRCYLSGSQPFIKSWFNWITNNDIEIMDRIL